MRLPGRLSSAIDVLADIAPSVRFNKPGRDTTASPVEEVLAEVRADDDFGVKQLDLFYSVNGGPEKTINLFGGSRALTEVTATHTLYLEELGLKPGDFVSYYAKADDNDAVAGRKTTTSARKRPTTPVNSSRKPPLASTMPPSKSSSSWPSIPRSRKPPNNAPPSSPSNRPSSRPSSSRA